MRILVTGGTGFVGSNIVSYLAEQGHDVVVLDVASPDAMLESFWHPVSDRIHFVQGDISHPCVIEDLLRDQSIDSVVHAAAITTASGDEGLARLLRVNLQGSVTMLDAARAIASVKRFIFISSGAVYGPTPEGSPISEDATIATDIAYGQAKYAIEAAVRYAHCESEFTTAVLRLGWIYGPMERPTAARTRMSEICQLCHCALREGEIRINDTSAIRDWGYSKDVGQAVEVLLSSPSVPHRVYNFSGGEGYTIARIVELLEERIPKLCVRLVPEDRANVVVNVRNRRGHLDIRRLHEDVGFTPINDMASGLDATIAWLQKKGEL